MTVDELFIPALIRQVTSESETTYRLIKALVQLVEGFTKSLFSEMTPFILALSQNGTTSLNRFKTKTVVITTADQTAYTAPAGYTAIVLCTYYQLWFSRCDCTIACRSSTTTEIIKQGNVPQNDAFVPMDGKLVLETNDSIKISASANTTLKLILSILETAN